MNPFTLDPYFGPRQHVQSELDAAQIYVIHKLAHLPYVVEQLQYQYQNALMECNNHNVNPEQILQQQLRLERMILDAHNRHRLGRATHGHYVPSFTPVVQYDVRDNIPRALEWFPLHFMFSYRNPAVIVPEIYQCKCPDLAVPQVIPVQVQASRTSSTPCKSPASVTPRKKLTGRSRIGYDKLLQAPPKEIGFPNGNLTMVEILTYLPQSLKSWDAIDRFLHNGAFSTTFGTIINKFRNMPNGKIKNNTILGMMKPAMAMRAHYDATYEDWAVTKHQTLPKPTGFDSRSLSVAGFRLPGTGDPRRMDSLLAKSIPFRDLANGVKITPTGADALDLTRCVQYAVGHPSENWMYPDHFTALVDLLGGPATPTREHEDASAVNRYTSDRNLKSARLIASRARDNRGRLLKKEKGGMKDLDSEDLDMEELDKESVANSPSTHRHSRFLARNDTDADDIDASDSDEYQGPRKKIEATASRRTSGRITRFSGDYNVEDALADDKEASNEEQRDQPKRLYTAEGMRLIRRA